LDPDTRKELLGIVREQFERHRNEKNLEKIRYYLAQGKREFHELQMNIELTIRGK